MSTVTGKKSWASRVAVVAWLACAAAPSWAGIEVFTVAGSPVVNVPEGAAVVELDQPGRLDAELSDGLPTTESAATEELQRRMQGAEWQDMAARYQRAARGVARAWMLGVEQVPAVVLDGEYVVYGEHDVQAALNQIQDYQRQQGQGGGQ